MFPPPFVANIAFTASIQRLDCMLRRPIFRRQTLLLPSRQPPRPGWLSLRSAHAQAAAQASSQQPKPHKIPLITQWTYALTSLIYTPTFAYTLLLFFAVYTSSPITIRAINGASMAPTLSPELLENPVSGRKDRLLFRRMWPGKLRCIGDERVDQGEEDDVTRVLKRGMLVLLHSPQDPGKMVVKRVVGLPGDVVTPLARKVKVRRSQQKQPANEEKGGACTHVRPLQGEEAPESEPVTVPFGHIWVEGDNPSASYDSNDYGPASQSLIAEMAWGYARLPWKEDARQRVHWENDGWERRMGMVGRDGRLNRRESMPGWKGDEVPEEWRIWRASDA